MRLFDIRERELFEKICSYSQTKVFQMMSYYLRGKYNNVITTPSYIFAAGDIPVALVAHADTVFKIPPKNFFYDKEKNVMWSPDGMGADDRAGIFAIMKIIASGLRPHIIITADEERGCLGASKMAAKMKEFPAPLKFMIQLDRRGTNDSVYYDCDNFEFEEFINKFGFETKVGSFSDISVLAPTWGIAAVNLSVGYFEEHFETEHLYVDALFNTIEKVKKILTHVKENDVPTYEYVESPFWFDSPHGLKYSEWSYDLAQDEARCQFCQDVHKKVNLLPIHFPGSDMVFHLCNDCYSHSVNNIEWCSKCNEGFFLTDEESSKVVDHHNWVCNNCKENNNDNSGTV